MTEQVFDRIYERSWGLISTTAREVLMGLLMLEQEVTWEGLRAAAGLEEEPEHDASLAEAVTQLRAFNLLQVSPSRPRIYSMHQLTHRFLERAVGRPPEEGRWATLRMAPCTAWRGENCNT